MRHPYRSLLLTVIAAAAAAPASMAIAESGVTTFPVSGDGVHYFSQAITHAETETSTGVRRRTSDIILLRGSLEGFVLYHATTDVDSARAALVTTGSQVFSGTIAGSEPVLLYDDTFRFDVNLATGAVTGEVHLRRSKDAADRGSWFECDLIVTGTGMTAEGDGTFDYTGTCRRGGAQR